ncbi:hypothetical protein E2C01_053138 [Portunus trituberculatus]|uniref:Uncharacterized protein n=1 Tax=Portunus trituberculatus TaxID=210409 RepID=A0A5B7GNI5_PORTR|nr:hypothetical protein [Portunus trituberculatus]
MSHHKPNFAVVVFVPEGDVSVIPCGWLNKSETYGYWPSFKDVAQRLLHWTDVLTFTLFRLPPAPAWVRLVTLFSLRKCPGPVLLSNRNGL